MRFRSSYTALLVLALLGCQRAPQPGTLVQQSNKSGDYVRQDWHLPSSPGAAQPALATTVDGRVLLSWINSVPGRRNALQFAQLDRNGQWQSAPRTIAVGDSLLADASNTPRMSATADGALWVDWLQKTAGGDGSDLMLSRSVDGGFNWSAAARVNVVADHAERGFAALWPASRNSVGVAWLDGPGMATDASAPAHAIDTEGAALNAAVFDANLQRSAQMQVDAMVCGGGQTGVAMTTQGALLVYRDRSAQGIDDIATARLDAGNWTQPRPVHVDGGKATTCPVNGPSVAADGANVVVAWYTAAGIKPSVQIARSADAGDHFAAPLVLDRDAAVRGRVAIALDARQAWVVWMRQDAHGQSLWMARYTTDLSRQLQRMQLATLQGRGAATGFPQLALRAGNAYVAWTDAIDGAPQLRGATLTR